jgi:hypothetical protein
MCAASCRHSHEAIALPETRFMAGGIHTRSIRCLSRPPAGATVRLLFLYNTVLG